VLPLTGSLSGARQKEERRQTESQKGKGNAHNDRATAAQLETDPVPLSADRAGRAERRAEGRPEGAHSARPAHALARAQCARSEQALGGTSVVIGAGRAGDGTRGSVLTLLAPSALPPPCPQLVFLQLPNVIGIEPTPFDPATYVFTDPNAADTKAAAAAAAEAEADGSQTQSQSQAADDGDAEMTDVKAVAKEKAKSKKKGKEQDKKETDSDSASASASVSASASAAGAGVLGGGPNLKSLGKRGKAHPDAENMIRWRVVTDATGAQTKESNARLVRWADGSVQLFVGTEVRGPSRAAPISIDR
jgi:hypothetical protein